LWRHTQWQARPIDEVAVFEDIDREAAAALLRRAVANEQGRWIIGTTATQILEKYRIWGPGETLAASAEEAVQWAEKFGYPVVLKIASPDIPHKSDVGGVALDLNDAESVRLAFDRIMANARRAKAEARIDGVTVQQRVHHGHEVIIGAVRDEQFGPLMVFGAGGIEVEGARDVAFGLAPLSREDAEKMIDATFAGRRLRGYRNIPPADRETTIQVLLRLAQLANDFPQIAEVEINPLRVQEIGQGAVAVDVRIRVTM
jgi:acetyltransferase